MFVRRLQAILRPYLRRQRRPPTSSPGTPSSTSTWIWSSQVEPRRVPPSTDRSTSLPRRRTIMRSTGWEQRRSSRPRKTSRAKGTTVKSRPNSDNSSRFLMLWMVNSILSCCLRRDLRAFAVVLRSVSCSRALISVFVFVLWFLSVMSYFLK